jgi:hypothetical protein
MVTLTIIRYPRKYVFFALLSMALFRLPLSFNKKISFFKLLGSGKGGKFVKSPDWRQWGIFTVSDTADIDNIKLYGSFINKWLSFFNSETWTVFLEPIQSHGKWDRKEPFGVLSKENYEGSIAVLTRATINLSKVKAFWKDIEAVATTMENTAGFKMALSIGETPFVKQATFSVWESKESMMSFAYKMHQHNDIIRKTRVDKWYKEELFARFKIINTVGTINGKNPLLRSID